MELRNIYPAEWKQQCLLVVLSCLCYGISIWGDFVFDDNEALLNNKDVDLSTSWTQAFKNDFWGTNIFSNSSHKSYRPLTVMSFRLNTWLVGGLNPMSFHLVNIFLHAAVSLLYLNICTTICNLSSEQGTLSTVPMVAALIFTVHPIHTESVAGIVGRAELMSAIFFFLSLQCYMRASEENTTIMSMCSWLILSVTMVVISLLFKEQGITAMGICIVFDVIIRLRLDPLDLVCFKACWQCSRKDIRWSRFVARVVTILSAVGIIVALRLSTGSPTFNPEDNAASFADSILTRVLSYNYIYAINSWLLVNPWWLCFDWSMGCIPLLESVLDVRIIPVLLFWMALCLLAVFCVSGEKGPFKRVVSVSLGVLVITFLPASNLLIRVGFVVAERVLYLPSAGYCLLIALGVNRVRQFSNKRVWSCVTLLITLFIVRSIQRSSEWREERSLFLSGLKVCPNNAKVYYNVGKVKSDGGDTAMGMTAYSEAIRLYPEYDQALNNLGNLLKGMGNHEEAEQMFHRAIAAKYEIIIIKRNKYNLIN